MATSTGKRLVEQQYKKELRRIQQFIRRAEKRGYEFGANIIPNRPKKITEASVRRLHKIRPSQLYSNSIAYDTEGFIISGAEKRKDENIQRALKALETRRARHSTIAENYVRKGRYGIGKNSIDEVPDGSIKPKSKYAGGKGGRKKGSKNRPIKYTERQLEQREHHKKELKRQASKRYREKKKILKKLAEKYGADYVQEVLPNEQIIKPPVQNPVPEPVVEEPEKVEAETPFGIGYTDTSVLPSEIEYALEWIERVIENCKSDVCPAPQLAVSLLESTLRNEISKYGREAVARSIAQTPPDVMAQVEHDIWYERCWVATGGIQVQIWEIITGEIADIQTVKMLSADTLNYTYRKGSMKRVDFEDEQETEL